MKWIIVVGLTSFLIIGCGYLSFKKYNMGQSFEFKDKSDFISYLKKKYSIPLEQYLYIDSSSYSKFVFNQLNQNKTSIYIGAFLNDSNFVRPSLMLEKNSSCAGRIEKEILTVLSAQKYPDSLIQKTNRLSEYKIKFLGSGQIFDINKRNVNINLLLVYSYGMGSYYDRLFRDIANLKNIFIICVDPVYKLK